jgi:hypothetical protein
VQSPSIGDRAILHLKSISFAENDWFGPNVLGVNKYLDIERTFDLIYNKTQNLKSHMQRDSLYVDFGLMTSSGN